MSLITVYKGEIPMKIAIPIVSDNKPYVINDSLARAPYFALIDNSNNTVKTIVNDYYFQPGGAGVKVAQMLCDLNVKVVLAPRCGENAQNIFNQAQIDVYQTIGYDLQNNYDLFLQKALQSILVTLSNHHQEV
ncbi:MAG: dinitrogenase iron-molybdenum cofactor biosynthesis protein [Tenericutes bacterium HGW-Tenericutes-1]|jgi:predicted Fe-Mo cluster-binding NifX family protein|nr:MAG: dinitrogenase iron-molybdenum cofactor biosynthesis protein [Tenericutes bacterium HGW-Tenericutes-1]